MVLSTVKKKRCLESSFNIGKKRVLTVFWAVKNIVSTVKKDFFFSGFIVTKKVFQRSLNGYQKLVFTVYKKTCFHSVFTMKKGVLTVFPGWCFHRKNKKCVITVFERWEKELFRCGKKRRCFTLALQWQKRCFNNVWTVTKKLCRRLKERCFHSSFTVKKNVSTVF